MTVLEYDLQQAQRDLEALHERRAEGGRVGRDELAAAEERVAILQLRLTAQQEVSS